MTGDNGLYRLYRLYPADERVEQRLVARFAIVGGVVHHLEDHDGVIDDIVPEGKLSGWALHRMMGLEHSPYWRLVEENDIEQGEHPDLLEEADGGDPWDAPQGEPAQETKGKFTLTKKSEQPLQKMAPELAQHLKVLRHAAPESANFLARQMFGDTMVRGVGNKLAYQDFMDRQRPGGVHVLIDGNDFGSINKQWGQSVGDEAIKAMGGALSRASRVNRGKLFRVGGDEFRAWFESPAHAHAFARHARKELEALPPVMGQHRHSVSIGLATSPDDAEQALIQAKNAKKSRMYAPGHAETHAHSMLPGAAGPVQVSSPPEVPHLERPKTPSPVQGPAFSQPLARSEDPEVQELRLRKFEADLAKMAVIHDGPKPMSVWRVQNDAGEGPYEGGPKESQFEDRNEYLAAKEKHRGVLESIRLNGSHSQPLPQEDFSQRDLRGLRNKRFGFASQGDAERWFSPQDMAELRDLGFTLRQVLARKVWRSKSGAQVIFEPHDGK